MNPDSQQTGIPTITAQLAIMKNNLCSVMCAATGKKQSLYIVSEELQNEKISNEFTSNINRITLTEFPATKAWNAILDCGQRRFFKD
jgi:hypothetical protein